MVTSPCWAVNLADRKLGKETRKKTQSVGVVPVQRVMLKIAAKTRLWWKTVSPISKGLKEKMFSISLISNRERNVSLLMLSSSTDVTGAGAGRSYLWSI